MKDVSDKSFGVVIAFLLPGFVLLWGLSYSSPQVESWLQIASAEKGPAIGGFLYATLASLALGLLVSAARQIVLDQLLYSTGIDRIADGNWAKLKDKDVFVAFNGAIENQYRYYQYYGNTLVAIVVACIVYLLHGDPAPSRTTWTAALVAIIVLFFASRIELKSFCKKAAQILA
jgi:hypothetical protein